MDAADTLEKLQYIFCSVRRSYANNAARLCRSKDVGTVHSKHPAEIAFNLQRTRMMMKHTDYWWGYRFHQGLAAYKDDLCKPGQETQLSALLTFVVKEILPQVNTPSAVAGLDKRPDMSEAVMDGAKTFVELQAAFRQGRDSYARNAVRLCKCGEVRDRLQDFIDWDPMARKTPAASGIIQSIAYNLRCIKFQEDVDGPCSDYIEPYEYYLECADAGKRLQALRIFTEVHVLKTKIPTVPNWVGPEDPLSSDYVDQS